MASSTLLSVVALLALTVRAADFCYGQYGNQDPTLAICDPSAATSSCCSYGEYCYSNGLCQRPGVTNTNDTILTIYGVRGCTDANATTGECYPFAHCIEKGVGITVCSASNTYCCYGTHGCDCNNSTQTFTLPAGKIITTLPASAVTTSTSSAASSSTTSASSSSIAASSSAASSSGSASNNSVAIGAGVGVGVGVAILIAAGIGFWFWRRRRNAAAGKKGADSFHNYSVDAKHGLPATTDYGYTAAPQSDPSYEPGLAHHTMEMDANRAPVQLDDTSMLKSPYHHGPTELA